MEIIYENGALPEIQQHLFNFIMLAVGYTVTVLYVAGALYATYKALTTKDTWIESFKRMSN